MNVLEKILEEIKQYTEDVYECDLDDIVEYQRRNREDNCTYIVQGIEEATEFIRSHMDDVPKCGECSRRKWYQIGYEDGKKEDGWIPYTIQNIPKKENVYLVTCDDEEYPVKRMRFKKEDEYGLWYDNYGVYDGIILAWQPLPEPYKAKEKS